MKIYSVEHISTDHQNRDHIKDLGYYVDRDKALEVFNTYVENYWRDLDEGEHNSDDYKVFSYQSYWDDEYIIFKMIEVIE